MIQSMTGFGQAKKDTRDWSVAIELKSLNSKYFDLLTRIPKEFSDKEMDLRSILSKRIGRGKVYITLAIDYLNPEKQKKNLNKSLARLYYSEIMELARDLGVSSENILPKILDLPDVFEGRDDESLQEEWNLVIEVLDEALEKFTEFRKKEGDVLKKEMILYLEKIREITAKIDSVKDNRVEVLKEKFRKKVEEVRKDYEVDSGRMEQELVFYIEKLDITEEIVRLNSHLDYFIDTLEESGSGKKLNFISQEMGREINTIGSKANDPEIQKMVVAMKDELEKIKEQTQNIL